MSHLFWVGQLFSIPLRCKIFAAYKNIRPLLYAIKERYKDGAKL